FGFLLLALRLEAHSLNNYTITSGPYSGKKLIDVVEAYTSEKEHIPTRAIHQAFNFFDLYVNTTRTYSYLGINESLTKPGTQYLGGVKTGTAETIANQRYLTIFDLNLSSSLKRLHVIDLETGEISSYEAAHGIESDCGSKKPGYACTFISDRESKASPLGFFQTGQVYNSEEHGGVVTLNGLEKSNDFPSSIVIHSASYVHAGHAGRSNGCPAVSEANIGRVRDDLKGGTLFYFYHNSLESGTPAVSGLQQMSPAAVPEVPAAAQAAPNPPPAPALPAGNVNDPTPFDEDENAH
ncbi:MAG: murein L,D-transpeptidase catalytic domain-containing protein, partial [Pseudobdellovibrio sp.]